MKELWCIACAEDHHVQCLGRGCQCAHLVEVAVPSLSVSGEPTSKARLHVCQTQGGWWSVRIHGPELWEQLDDGSPRWAEIEIGRGDTEAGARQDAQQWLASFPSGVSVEPIRALIAEWLADAAKCDAVIRKVNRRGDGDAFALVELRQEQSALRGCAKQLESLLPLPVPPAIPTEAPGWICSCGSRSMRQDGGPHCENCGEVVTYRGPWVAPGNAYADKLEDL